MKIVVLDGHTLNPGDISWAPIEALGELVVYPHSTVEQALQRCVDADILLTNKTVIDTALFNAASKLRFIGVLATGYNVVDLAQANQRGIAVSNVPGYSTDSVAQFVFAQLLNWAQPVAYYANSTRQGRWSQSRDFCYYDHSMPELAGKTLGVIGFGAIGQRVAAIGQAFGMHIRIYSRSQPPTLAAGMQWSSLQQLAQHSDVVSLHCPLTEANHGFIDRQFLSAMKPGSYLINTSRGPLINEDDLAQALNSGDLAGAALDVLSSEPPSPDNPLLNAKNCTVTPHIAWATQAARARLMGIMAENIAQFLAGCAVNVVNSPAQRHH
jgi:glycerate dehydrogenase